MFWGNAYGNPCIHEEPREPYRKGDRSTAMGHSHLQGRTHRERILEASRRQKLTSRIRTSDVPGGEYINNSFIDINKDGVDLCPSLLISINHYFIDIIYDGVHIDINKKIIYINNSIIDINK